MARPQRATQARLVGAFSAARPYLLLALAVLLVGAFQVPFLNAPLSLDEGVYFTVAQSDALPYVEAFDHKPPLIYAWYEAALWLNGGAASPAAVHLLALAALALTTVCVFELGRLVAGPNIGAAAALMFSLLTSNHYVFNAAETETFGLVPLTLAAVFAVRGKRSGCARWLWLSGALGGIAIMTKTPLGFMELGLIAYVGVHRWRRVVPMAAGAGATAALVTLPWLVSGHLSEFWQANVTFNLAYGAMAPLWARPFLLVLGFAGASMASLPVLGFQLFARRLGPEHRELRRLALCWGGGALLAVASTGTPLIYYFIIFAPPVALLSALGLERIRAEWPSRPHRLLVYGVLGPLLAVSVASLLPLYTAPSAEASHLRTPNVSAPQNVLAASLSSEVASRTRASDTIYVVGNAVPVYALSNRSPASRVIYSGFATMDERLLPEMVHDVESSPPAVIVQLISADKARWEDTVASALHPLLESRYRIDLEKQFRGETGRIWVRVD